MDQCAGQQLAFLTKPGSCAELASEPAFILAVRAFGMDALLVELLREGQPQFATVLRLWPFCRGLAHFWRHNAANAQSVGEVVVGFAVEAGVGQNNLDGHSGGRFRKQHLEGWTVGPRTPRCFSGEVQVRTRVAERSKLGVVHFDAAAFPGEVVAGEAGLITRRVGSNDGRGQYQFAVSSDADSSAKQRCEAPFSASRSCAYFKVEKLGRRFSSRAFTTLGQSLRYSITPR